MSDNLKRAIKAEEALRYLEQAWAYYDPPAPQRAPQNPKPRR